MQNMSMHDLERMGWGYGARYGAPPAIDATAVSVEDLERLGWNGARYGAPPVAAPASRWDVAPSGQPLPSDGWISRAERATTQRYGAAPTYQPAQWTPMAPARAPWWVQETEWEYAKPPGWGIQAEPPMGRPMMTPGFEVPAPMPLIQARIATTEQVTISEETLRGLVDQLSSILAELPEDQRGMALQFIADELEGLFGAEAFGTTPA